ncbi:MAG: CHAT domain-containing protein [Chitinophagales bacterium]
MWQKGILLEAAEGFAVVEADYSKREILIQATDGRLVERIQEELDMIAKEGKVKAEVSRGEEDVLRHNEKFMKGLAGLQKKRIIVANHLNNIRTMRITYSDIRDLLARPNLTKAIEYALLLAKQTGEKNYPKSIRLFSARNNRNQEDYDNGVLRLEDYRMETNRITVSMDSTIDNMEKDYPNFSVEVDNPNGDPEPKAPDTDKQKILFLAANPSDKAGLQTDLEYRLIRAELERGKKRDLYQLLHPQLSLTVGELLRALDEKPDIIHFSGHGTKDGIMIVKDDNTHSIIPTEALEYLFESAKEHVKIVVLNACHSAAQAKVISKFGIYVIGNNLEIGDNAAVNFARTLYLSLGEGNPLTKAYKSAKFALMIQNPSFVKVVEVWKDGKLLSL